MTRPSRSRRPEIPAPGLDALDDLLAGLRAAGLDIECRVTGRAVPLAPAADLTAYRVIQESLTNVRKHSAGRRSRLALGYERAELSITVDDLGGAESAGGTGEAAPVPHGDAVFCFVIFLRAADGIEGMRERVLAIGGRFAAGSRPGGGFRVTAALPYQPLGAGAGGAAVTIRVVVADDQPLLRTGFKALISSADDLEVVGEAGDGREAARLARAAEADVVLMDIRMPVLDGLAATRLITADPGLASVKVLILTTFEIDEYVFEALRSGASGFLGKSAEADELLAAIRTVSRGDALLSPAATRTLIGRFLAIPAVPAGVSDAARRGLDSLTEREREISALVATGLSNDEIAARLVLSPATVKTHVNRAMVKVGARDRAQLVVFAYRCGLVC